MPDPAPTTYGSDDNGLIWAYRFRPGESGTPLSASEVASAITDGPGDDFLWVHCTQAHVNCERWLREILKLPGEYLESLHDPAGSTRIEQGDDALIAALNDVPFDFTGDPGAIASVRLCLQPRLLVSARIKPLRSIDRLRAAVKAGADYRSATEVMAHLLREQAGVLGEICQSTAAKVDSIEDELLADRRVTTRRDLGDLRRLLVRLQRLLAPEPAAMFRLLSRPPLWLTPDDVQDLRQAGEEFSAEVGDAASLVERVKLLQEELAAHLNEQTNRTLFLLTVVTVFALPINIVAGLFGMNVGGIPWSENRHGFALIVVALILVTAGTAVVTIRRRGG